MGEKRVAMQIHDNANRPVAFSADPLRDDEIEILIVIPDLWPTGKRVRVKARTESVNVPFVDGNSFSVCVVRATGKKIGGTPVWS